jgi:hypothetical protein
MKGIERDFLMSSPFPPYEVKERYFYLCQQFIFLNITDEFTQKILLDQLLNYYETCPQDLETLYLIWIHYQDISRKDFFHLKKKFSYDDTVAYEEKNSSSNKCVFFSRK